MNSPLKAWVRALELTAPIERRRSVTFGHLIDDLAERFDAAPALIGTQDRLTYRELAAAAHRHARWGLSQGLGAGDVVGLLMPNCPEYLAIWLGLTRIGVVVALLNTHATGEPLAHSINIVRPRGLIVAAPLVDAVRKSDHRLPRTIRCWAQGAGDHDLPRLDLEAASMPSGPPDAARGPAPTLDDRALYIYTSGTTGLPKAAIVTHFRVMQWSHWFAGLMGTGPSDRMYDCLPMYHSIGGVVATGATLVGGGAVVLRERFSAREFWKDVVAERCTLFQYIGELCRYLVASPPHPDETRHALRLCCGNGLRPEVWEAFKSRFRIPRILEYYASTEGSFSLYNCEGQPGAIGRIPPFLAHRMPVAIVRFDFESGEPLRDASGRCVRCAPNEPGEAIGQIADAAGRPSSRFEGYADREASSRKLLRDVFAAGDTWYRTGDLMRQDDQGFFYFVDRIGDTFRWKGENVSTSEVAAVLAACPGVAEAAVYGVQVPGTDGRAGMAALTSTEELDLARLHEQVRAQLPDYARPLFVRIVPAIAQTGTFKQNKQALVREGYDPSVVAGDLFFDDRERRAYVRLDAALFEHINAGRIRL